MKAQLLTVTSIYDTYNFGQLYIKKYQFIMCNVSNTYFTENNREGRELSKEIVETQRPSSYAIVLVPATPVKTRKLYRANQLSNSVT